MTTITNATQDPALGKLVAYVMLHPGKDGLAIPAHLRAKLCEAEAQRLIMFRDGGWYLVQR